MYFWYQRSGGEDAWLQGLSDHREKIVATQKPAFVTVLDAHSAPDDTWGREEYAKMRYSGPLYFDWDADDISEVIPNFHKFLARLNEDGVNLKCVRFFATGGRGFHAEFPEAMFNPKVPKNGVLLLPYVYKEMALEMAVDTLDLRVYTGRKGRMWRTPGVQRSNGKYKVSISLEQAMAMTPELYDELTSSPIPEYAVYREPPELSTHLAAMFKKAQDKVDGALKARAKGGAADEALLAKFKGKFPATAQRIMSGKDVMPNVGFHKIAMQLAITANALGKSREELVEAAAALCDTHESDSQRYNSPRKRREELARMWDYTHDNPCYGFSKGGLRSLLAPGVPSPDLDNAAESIGVGHVPVAEDEGEEAEAPFSQDVQDEIDSARNSLLEGLMIVNEGVFRRTADGAKMVSNLSFRSPSAMMDSEDGLAIGIEADLVADGRKYGRQLIELPVFASRNNLNKFCSGRGAVFNGSEAQAAIVQLMLTRAAHEGGKVVYVVHREGLDLIQNPLVKGRVLKDVVWAHVDGVLCHKRDDGTDATYRYRQKVGSGASPYKTDIHETADLVHTADSEAFIKALLNVNSPVVVAQMLGWFTSCFHKQFYQVKYDQFPLLHPNGPAGSGKTQTTKLMARMFYLKHPPVVLGCSQQSASNFALKSAWTASASVPLILDEYKPSELGPIRHDFLTQHFRLLYNQGSGASGGINRGGADTSFRDVTNYSYSAPTVYLGESQEMQTAVVQRSVAVSFTHHDARAHTRWFEQASALADYMPVIGGAILRHSLLETVDSMAEQLDPTIARLRKMMKKDTNDRQIYNMAVILAGVDYLDRVLRGPFGDMFCLEFDNLRQALLDNLDDVTTTARSEVSKVLNIMSMISRVEASDGEFAIREGQEYVVGNGYMEIILRESFMKYFSWCKRKGYNPLFTNDDAFIAALAKSHVVLDRHALSSPLRGGSAGALSKIFRLDLERLAEDGVEPFRTKS